MFFVRSESKVTSGSSQEHFDISHNTPTCRSSHTFTHTHAPQQSTAVIEIIRRSSSCHGERKVLWYWGVPPSCAAPQSSHLVSTGSLFALCLFLPSDKREECPVCSLARTSMLKIQQVRVSIEVGKAHMGRITTTLLTISKDQIYLHVISLFTETSL